MIVSKTSVARCVLWGCSAFLALISGAHVCAAYSVPDTGQLSCYNENQKITCPGPGEDYYGQDATYSIVGKKYEVKDNDTVIDIITGLEWQRNPDTELRSWSSAMDYCNNLVTIDADDWRAPTRKELLTIVNMESAPTIDTKVFTGVGANMYWTSTVYANDNTQSWLVEFGSGRSFFNLQEQTFHNVVCVRGKMR